MAWQDLLQSDEEYVTVPYTGGLDVRLGARSWRISGAKPPGPCWGRFRIVGRRAMYAGRTAATDLQHQVKGYLVGDHLVVDVGHGDAELERVHLLRQDAEDQEPDKFTRVRAGRAYEGGPLIFMNVEMPEAADGDMLDLFLRHRSTCHVDYPKDVRAVGATPALYRAFHLELKRVVDLRRHQEAIEKYLREQEEKRLREERRQELIKQLGDGAVRRELAQVDFEKAAAAALAVGGAKFLDHRKIRGHEVAVRFELDGGRYECTCDERTMQIVDSGICLTAHGYDEYEDGTKGDTWFTLESLPAVIREAVRDGLLVVYRHAR